jgi:thiamine-phosphate pyrophosphorylase
LRAFLRGTDRRVIALGGVDEDRLETVRELGFAGAAVLGAVWRSADPADQFRRLQAQCA